MKEKKTSRDTASSVEWQEMLRLLRQQNEMIQRQCDMLADMRNQLRRANDTNMPHKLRQSRDQLRQLSIALEAVERDPLHNVKKAAEHAFKNSKGYSSVDSLRMALGRKLNSRK